jgi:predicted MFS family arabinose efflux permease
MLYLKKSGLPEVFYLSTIGIFNMIMFIVSPILGFMIDRNKVKIVLYITITSLLVFNILFYSLDISPLLFASLGLVAWGVQRVGAQITFSAMIFRSISDKSYGTAIGVYSLLSGIGNLIASSICGHLTQYSFEYIFLFSGANALICLIITIILCRKKYLIL